MALKHNSVCARLWTLCSLPFEPQAPQLTSPESSCYGYTSASSSAFPRHGTKPSSSRAQHVTPAGSVSIRCAIAARAGGWHWPGASVGDTRHPLCWGWQVTYVGSGGKLPVRYANMPNSASGPVASHFLGLSKAVAFQFSSHCSQLINWPEKRADKAIVWADRTMMVWLEWTISKHLPFQTGAATRETHYFSASGLISLTKLCWGVGGVGATTIFLTKQFSKHYWQP